MHKQFSLFSQRKYESRKNPRAIGIRQCNHVTMKARVPLLRMNHEMIKALIHETQLRFGMKIYSLAIMEKTTFTYSFKSRRVKYSQTRCAFSQVKSRLDSIVEKSGSKDAGAVSFTGEEIFEVYKNTLRTIHGKFGFTKKRLTRLR